MKKPRIPPDFDNIMGEVIQAGRMYAILHPDLSGSSPKKKYLHWDKLVHYDPPGTLTHREWWLSIKFSRMSQRKITPLLDTLSREFIFTLTDPLPERLHQIDQMAGGMIRMPEQITNPDLKDQYYVSSLLDEAITSSQLEGAATTRKVARDMIRSGRSPRDHSERMILNNYLTMKRIGTLKDQSLSPQLVLEIHRQVTEGTLEDPTAAGRLRRADEQIDVADNYGEVLHQPPPADQLEQRLSAMCAFANGKTPDDFVHPVIRSIILHFWLAYDHPFVDGNGRTARALFYWSMLHHGYWLFEFISISQVIHKRPAKYGRAFLYTETDDNDLTYFILFHLEIIRLALDELHKHLARKTKQLRRLEKELRGITTLNPRQRVLINHALRHPHQQYTIESHKTSNKVAYQTARSDLLTLRKLGLLMGEKSDKTWYFLPAKDIEKKLTNLS